MEEESLSTSTAEDKEEPVKLELVVLEVAIIHAYHAHDSDDTRITCLNTKLCSANQKLFRAYSQMPAILKNSKIMPGIISAPLMLTSPDYFRVARIVRLRQTIYGAPFVAPYRSV